MKKLFTLILLVTMASLAMAQSHYKSSEPIFYKNKSDFTIDGLMISGGTSACIKLIGCTNVHITNCKLMNGTTVYSNGVDMLDCKNVTVDNCFITKVATGVYAQRSSQIVVTNNQFLNMVGPYPRGAYVQYNNVSGGGNKITHNKGENIFGESNPEDGINLYKSNGIAEDPILVADNMLRGGGPSPTGSGITVGDQGGSYELVKNNICVNTGNIGIQAAGGTDITIINNTIFSERFEWSHLGLGCGNYSKLPIANITISGNKVRWTCGKAADLAWYPKGTTSVQKDVSYQKTIEKPIGWETNIQNADIDGKILPKVLITAK